MTSISTLMASAVSGADSLGRVSRSGELHAEIDCSSASVQRATITAGFTAKPASDWAEVVGARGKKRSIAHGLSSSVLKPSAGRSTHASEHLAIRAVNRQSAQLLPATRLLRACNRGRRRAPNRLGHHDQACGLVRVSQIQMPSSTAVSPTQRRSSVGQSRWRIPRHAQR